MDDGRVKQQQESNEGYIKRFQEPNHHKTPQMKHQNHHKSTRWCVDWCRLFILHLLQEPNEGKRVN
eukprot:scaffold81139_cov17-Tisochrysis_lutea.AAC.1